MLATFEPFFIEARRHRHKGQKLLVGLRLLLFLG
jgi:hypothetical protein